MAHANGVMMQYFHWYSPEDGSLWKEVATNAKDLAAAGIDHRALAAAGLQGPVRGEKRRLRRLRHVRPRGF